jgi:type IV pilus assembly protein PilA
MSARDQHGFTIVEVLVVCIVIGVLAAIALPAFLNQTKKADDAGAKSYLNTASHAIEARSTERDTYVATVQDLVDVESSLGDATGLAVSGTTRTYAVEMDSASGVHYTLERLASGAMHRDCAPIGQGGCSATADGNGNRW